MRRYSAVFFGVLLGVTLTAAVCLAEPPIDLGDRRELFVDRYLIADLDNLSLRLHHPQLTPLSDAPAPIGAYCTVIHDPSTGTYFYYYRGRHQNSGEGDEHQYAYFCMTSKDGVHWEKPSLNLFPDAGRGLEHMVLWPENPITHNFSPFLDTRPGVPAEERFKAVAGSTRHWGKGTGLYGFVSADGFRWRKLQEEPVFPEESAGPPEVNNYFDSQNVAFWSAAENQYVCYYRITWLPHSRGWKQSLRGIGRTTSPDFIHWTAGEELPVNLPDEQFYSNQTSPYFRAPHVYIALPWRYLPPVPGNIHYHASDTVLMTARGAAGYDRTFTQAFIRPGLFPLRWTSPEPKGFPQGVAAALNVVQTGEHEMSIYVREQRYTLRLDGFASLHSDSMEYGEMTSKLFVFRGDALEINYSTSVAGRIFVELQDEHGRPLPGYTLDDCDVILGDEIARTVQWNGQSRVSELAGRPVRLHVRMRDADLYAFRFHETP